VQRHDPAGEGAVRHVAEPRALEQQGELVRPGEPANAGREVGVGRATLQELAEQRNDPVEPQAVERREQSPRLRDLEDPDPAARAEHARELAEPALEIRDVAHSEPDSSRVEGGVREWKREHVALDPLDCGGFPPRPLEHPR
jgi:hypothetical protein